MLVNMNASSGEGRRPPAAPAAPQATGNPSPQAPHLTPQATNPPPDRWGGGGG